MKSILSGTGTQCDCMTGFRGRKSRVPFKNNHCKLLTEAGEDDEIDLVILYCTQDFAPASFCVPLM